MADVLFLVITVAFFVIAAGFVRLCDKVIGPDADAGELHGAGEPEPGEAIAAPGADPAVQPMAGVR